MSELPEQESLEQRLTALQAALESRLAAVEAENADLRVQLAERLTPAARATIPQANRKLSRRKALARLGGVAAAAGVAATAATLATNAPEARAADGGAVLLGQSNTSTNQTAITNDGTANINSTLQVTANANVGAGTGAFTAIEAFAPLNGTGVLGEVDWLDGSASAGVVGFSFQQSSSLARRDSHYRAHGNSGTGPFPRVGVYGLYDGVAGESVEFGAGVVGNSHYGAGIAASSDFGIDLYLYGTGRFHQYAAISHAGPPVAADGAFDFSETIKDSKAVMWLSVADPSSSNIRWVRMGMVNGGALGGAMNFLPSPVRIIGSGSPPGVALAKNTHTNFGLAGVAGIPADATAVFGNATVYNAGGSGFVTLTPQGGSAATSSLNFTSSDQPLSNFVAVGLNGGAITVVVSNNQNVKFIYDVVGYCL